MDRQSYMESSDDDFHPPESQIKSDRIHHNDDSSDDIRDDDSDQPQQSDGTYDEDDENGRYKITKEQILEKELLKNAIATQQKRKPFQREIMGDIVDKLQNYEEVVRQKNGEDLVTLRIQQLVYTKLLVLTYGCSEFRLVLSHFHLGTAYLSHECVQQAIEHISIALNKNQKLIDEVSKMKQFHCIMENIFAQCLIKKQQYDDAIEVLQKSIDLADTCDDNEAEQVINRARILLAQCYTKHGNHEQAIRMIEKVILNTQESKSEEAYAFVLVQKANILAADKKLAGAIEAQDEAINLLIKNNYPKPEQVAEMYNKLADYYQQSGNSQNSLSCIQKVKTLYQQIYSTEDKRVIKARRRIATALLKNQRFKQAVNQLMEIIELQEKVFGESSLQAARTLKLLGTVYIRLETGDARAYLKRAMNIFNAHGNKKQVEEIKEKLKILMQTTSNNNELKILSDQDL